LDVSATPNLKKHEKQRCDEIFKVSKPNNFTLSIAKRIRIFNLGTAKKFLQLLNRILKNIIKPSPIIAMSKAKCG
jgi:hypothetical protein